MIQKWNKILISRKSNFCRADWYWMEILLNNIVVCIEMWWWSKVRLFWENLLLILVKIKRKNPIIILIVIWIWRKIPQMQIQQKNKKIQLQITI